MKVAQGLCLLTATLIVIVGLFSSPHIANADSITGSISMDSPWGMAFDSLAKVMYVSNPNSDTVTVVDALRNVVVDSIPVGDAPQKLDFHLVTKEVYVANGESGTISVIDSNTNTVTNTIAVGSPPEGVAYNQLNHNIYVTTPLQNAVVAIDGSTHKIVKTVSTNGVFPLGIEYNTVNQKLYIANQLSDSISVIDGKTDTLVGNILLPRGAGPVDLVPDTKTGNVYVSSNSLDTVSVIDGSSDTVIEHIRLSELPVPPLHSGPVGITYNVGNDRIYVAEQAGDRVSIIDTKTHEIVSRIRVGHSPTPIGYSGATGNIYVGNTNSNYVSIISTGSPAPDQAPPNTSITKAVDGNNAVLSLTNPSPAATVSKSITITFTGTDNMGISSFQCSLGGNPFGSCTSPIMFNNLASGSHTFRVRAIDTAGNVDPTPASFTWTILTPAQGIQTLNSFVNGMQDVSSSTKSSLNARLDGALRYLTDSSTANDRGACTQLDGFIRTANGFARAGSISTQQANQIVQTLPYSAQAIKTSLGCP